MTNTGNASAGLRIEDLLDPGTAGRFAFPADRPPGALDVLTGNAGGRALVVAAAAQGTRRGAIGVAEARALACVFDALSERPKPLVLWLDSAGARIDMGLEMLASFRELLARALHARLAGVRTIAIVRKVCYGGASMLAYLAARRILDPASRIAMSGPQVIAAMSGKSEIDPDEAGAVDALLGAAARARLVAGDRLCAGAAEPLRTALADCLDELPALAAPSIAQHHRSLFERLGRHGADLPRSPRPSPLPLRQRMDRLLPEGFETVIGEGIVRGVRLRAGREITITGIIGGSPLSAIACWMLAESIITSVRTRPERPIVILYDSPGHATTRSDEALLLSEYLVHLAETVQWAGAQGVAVSVWILGEASGGGYVALTAACCGVLALPGASIRVLPQAAVASILDDAPADRGGAERWRALGLVDRVLPADDLTEEVARLAGLPSR